MRCKISRQDEHWCKKIHKKSEFWSICDQVRKSKFFKNKKLHSQNHSHEYKNLICPKGYNFVVFYHLHIRIVCTRQHSKMMSQMQKGTAKDTKIKLLGQNALYRLLTNKSQMVTRNMQPTVSHCGQSCNKTFSDTPEYKDLFDSAKTKLQKLLSGTMKQLLNYQTEYPA